MNIEFGEYYKNNVVFTSETAQKRTDGSFRKQIDNDHYHGFFSISSLMDLPIDLITSLLTDYMHNICLGIMRKLLNTWIEGPLNVRLPNRKVQFSHNVSLIYGYLFHWNLIENLDP